MPALITLTLNPALDLATTTDHVAPTHKLRCGPVRRFAGGGGINVARVLHRLGAAVEARALVGGPAGAQLQALLQQEGVACQMHAIAGDTRENMSVLETRTGQEFRFVLPGPTVDHTQSQALLGALLPTAGPGSQLARWVIASGSLPPGMPHDFYAQLARAAQQQGTPLALDTSGAALAAALEVREYLPARDSHGVTPETKISLTFDGPVLWGSGNAVRCISPGGIQTTHFFRTDIL